MSTNDPAVLGSFTETSITDPAIVGSFQPTPEWPINGVCDYCHKGPKLCRVFGDVRSSDGALMDAFCCKDCTAANVKVRWI